MHRSDFRHLLAMPVRWGDMDVLGHVNNIQYFRYLESGRVAYFEDIMRARLDGRREGVVLADIQCAFIQQLRYPATVEVATRVSRLGNSSIHLLCALYRQGEEAPVAASRGVLVWFDYPAQRSRPVPAAVRDAVKAFEAIAPEE